MDRYLGVPACALLTVLARAFPSRTATRATSIAFIKLAEQGSTVLAASALRRAIDRVGRDNVFFVVFSENRFVLDAMDLVAPDNILTIDARTPVTAIRSGLAVLGRLRRRRVETTIDLEFFSRGSAVLAFLSGAQRRIGLHPYARVGPYRGNLLTHRVAYNPYLHASRLFLLLVEALDADADALPAWRAPVADLAPADAACVPAQQDIAAVTKLIQSAFGCVDVPALVLLNPNCSDLLPLRRWEGSRYVELARRLLAANPQLHIAFTGRPDEAEASAALVAGVSSRRCASLAGLTSMPQLLALYWLSRVLVTNDSGPAHFAALTPIEVVTLFGPETPALFAAQTPRNHVIWAALPCSPCVSALNNRASPCRDNRCMQAISVDAVFDATMDACRRLRAEGVPG